MSFPPYGCTCEECREKVPQKGILCWSDIAKETSVALKIQEKKVVEQDGVIKLQRAVIEERNAEIQRLIEKNGDLLDGLKSASKYIATEPKPFVLTIPNARLFNACVEFCREVTMAKDKLLMTRTKI